MAISKERAVEIAMRIAELTEDNEEITNLLKEVTDGVSDGYADADVYQKEGVTWKDAYTQLRKDYRKAFFSGSPTTEPGKNDPSGDDGDPGAFGAPPEPLKFYDLFK